MPTAPKLNTTLINFIKAQPMFFVGTAAPDGRVNISPKGLQSLRVLSETKIIWLNLSGSGNETAAHVRELPRMTLMFCAFEGDAMILRVYGAAKVLHPADEVWDQLIAQFSKMAGSRQIFELEIDLVQTSCGTGVPSPPRNTGLVALITAWCPDSMIEERNTGTSPPTVSRSSER